MKVEKLTCNLIFDFERWGGDTKTWASFTLQKKKEGLFIHKNFNIYFNKKTKSYNLGNKFALIIENNF